MIAGIDKYFEPIVVQKSTVGGGEWGDVDVWADNRTIQGRVRRLTGREIDANKPIYSSSHRLYTRSSVLVTERIKFDGGFYDVVGVNNVMNFDELYQIDLWQVV